MKYKNELVMLFNQAINNVKFPVYQSNARKLHESYYFLAYLSFLHNSIYYSRFSFLVNNVLISGIYLNEKVNAWSNAGIFTNMLQILRQKYIESSKFTNNNTLFIDGKIIINKFGTKSIGRCIKFKSKNTINRARKRRLQLLVDGNGTGLGCVIMPGNNSEISNMISILNKIGLPDANKWKKSKRFRKKFIADAGYNSERNKEFIKEKGYIPLIWYNKRKTKCEKKIKENKLTKKEMVVYKKRHLVENMNAWIEQIIPRMAKVFDKKIRNYLSMVELAFIYLFFKKGCV